MFDLDKCFTDVNKAGERDRGMRDKEGWQSRDRQGKDQEGGKERKGAELSKNPAFPCSSFQRAELGTHNPP